TRFSRDWSSDVCSSDLMELRTTQHKLELLEQKLGELSQNYQFNQRHLNEAKGIFQLRTTLRTLDVSESHILELIKKANYELSKEIGRASCRERVKKESE